MHLLRLQWRNKRNFGVSCGIVEKWRQVDCPGLYFHKCGPTPGGLLSVKRCDFFFMRDEIEECWSVVLSFWLGFVVPAAVQYNDDTNVWNDDVYKTWFLCSYLTGRVDTHHLLFCFDCRCVVSSRCSSSSWSLGPIKNAELNRKDEGAKFWIPVRLHLCPPRHIYPVDNVESALVSFDIVDLNFGLVHKCRCAVVVNDTSRAL